MLVYVIIEVENKGVILEKKQNKLKVSMGFRILLSVTVPSLKETELTLLSYKTFQPWLICSHCVIR